MCLSCSFGEGLLVRSYCLKVWVELLPDFRLVPVGLEKGYLLAASQSGHKDLRSLVLRPDFAGAGGLRGPPPGWGD